MPSAQITRKRKDYYTMIEQIKEMLAKQLRVDASTITESTNILEDLKADSLDIVEMLMTIEDKYGINVPDEDVSSLKTVGDVAKYIESNNKS